MGSKARMHSKAAAADRMFNSLESSVLALTAACGYAMIAGELGISERITSVREQVLKAIDAVGDELRQKASELSL